MLRRIRREQLQLGMFIERLEGSWFDHPFWREQFLLTTPEDLARLKGSGVETLLIDENKGTAVTAAPSAGVGSEAASRAPARRRPVLPEDAVRQCGRAIRYVFDEVRLGRSMKLREVATISDELARLLDRSPAAVLSLTRLRTLDNYTFLHSIAVSGLMIGFARHLQLPAEEIRLLGIAGLLHDIGKLAIPPSVLAKPSGLTPAELDLVRAHPVTGHDILSRDRKVPGIILDVCRHHHRRVDGGGYPEMADGAELSRHARMAAICDVYDAVTSVRPYKAAWDPVHALSQMSNWTGHFDPELLAAFVGFLGHGEDRDAVLGADEEMAQTRFSENGYSDPSA